MIDLSGIVVLKHSRLSRAGSKNNEYQLVRFSRLGLPGIYPVWKPLFLPGAF